VFNQFETLWPHAASYVKELTQVFPLMFKPHLHPGMNMYITPAGGNQIFPLHNDEQDVFILQVAGSKQWRVQRMPSRRYKGVKKLGTDETDVDALKANLEPGDLLYIPRQCKHEGFTEGSYSVSISLTNPNNEPDNEEDWHQGEAITQRHAEILKKSPLPQGRMGSLSMQSMMDATINGISHTKLKKKDYKYLKHEIANMIKSRSEAQHHERSTSNHVLNTLADAVMILYNSKQQPGTNGRIKLAQLPGMPGDTFGRVGIAVVLNWLGLARVQF